MLRRARAARLVHGVVTATLLVFAGACHRVPINSTANDPTTDRSTVTTESAATRARVRLLLVNDVYVSDTLRDGSGGLARLAAWRDSVERADSARVLFVMAGDLFSPSLLSKWFHGRQMVEAFNAARLDYATLGNHEFDVDRAQFTQRIDESSFQWLSANCGFGDGTDFPGVRGWDTVSVNGVRVGIFGTTILAEYRSWVRCTDPDVAARAAVDTLATLNVDAIVALTHQPIWHDSLTMAREPRITVLLGGHEHDGRRITFGDRILVKAASNVRSAIDVALESSPNGWRTRDTTLRPSRTWRENPAVHAVTAAWGDTLQQRIGSDRVLGVAPEPIDAVDSTSRGGESRFGNLVADAYRMGTRSDVALVNSGAMRLDDMIDAGPVTTHTIESVFLFADETRVLRVPITGRRLRLLLEHGVSARRLGTGAYPQVSGVHFHFNPRLPSGARLIGPITRPDGRIIGDEETLTLAMPMFPLCRGGDGYEVPEARAQCEEALADESRVPRSAALVIAHVESMGGTIMAPAVGRVQRSRQ